MLEPEGNDDNDRKKSGDELYKAKNKLDSNTLLIEPVGEKTQLNVFYFNENGGKLGRFSDNNMVVLEESVSRHHAEISYRKENFYLQDIGSTTGTFIKIKGKELLEETMILELGSRQFLVEYINSLSLLIEVRLKIIDGPDTGSDITFKLTDKDSRFSIGRKTSNNLSYSEDQHLSSNHAAFIKINDKLFLEDGGSTNGYL
jgi:pSer/pThr/pTyr-binding forkhead associated (FHA) protein